MTSTMSSTFAPPPSYCFNMSAVTDAERESDEAVVFWVEGVALGMVATAGVIGRTTQNHSVTFGAIFK